jgi:hypothetical protein
MTQRQYPSLARRLLTGGLPGMLFALALVLAWDARAVTTNGPFQLSLCVRGIRGIAVVVGKSPGPKTMAWW